MVEEEKEQKEKKSKTLNIFIIVLVVILIIFALFAIFYNPKQKDYISGLSFVEYNGFKLYKNPPQGNLTIYTLEFYSGKTRYLHHFTYLPQDLEDVYIEDGVVKKVLYKNEKEFKDRIYITVDPKMNANDILASSILTQILGKSDYGVFKILVRAAYTKEYEGEDFPIITCENADSNTGVIELRYGKLEVHSEGDCVVIQGQNYYDFRKASQKLAYMILGVIKE